MAAGTIGSTRLEGVSGPVCRVITPRADLRVVSSGGMPWAMLLVFTDTLRLESGGMYALLGKISTETLRISPGSCC